MTTSVLNLISSTICLTAFCNKASAFLVRAESDALSELTKGNIMKSFFLVVGVVSAVMIAAFNLGMAFKSLLAPVLALLN